VGTDVVKADSVESGFETVTREFGKLDILVNCAGISHITPFLECSEELWDLTINVNLKGAFLCSKSAIARMLTNRFGVVINMSSQSGKVGTSCYQAYCASKSGVIGLTQSLAVEFAKDGIRVNSICPGVVYTPMWEKQIKSYARKRNLKDEEVMPYLASKIPLGRIGQVEDVAGLAVFLASSESSYITGQAINVSGGQVMF
jgi:NAD(P)-dependent dehydrogenase (short-subunit alcohol dehydrogenase family)